MKPQALSGVQLPSKRSDSSAAEDGSLVWNRATSKVQVTSGGAFVDLVSGSGIGVTDGDKGDIVVSGTGATWSIDSAVLSTFGRTLIDDANASAARTTLGLGTAATQASTAFAAAAHTHGNSDLIDLDAAKLTGTLAMARIAALAITDAKINDLDAAKLTGTLAAARIAAASLPLSKIDNSTFANGEVLTSVSGSLVSRQWQGMTLQYVATNVPVSTSQRMAPVMFDGTAFSAALIDFRMPKAGKVVGASLISSAARTAGTATLEVRSGGVSTTFFSGAAVLDATNTQQVVALGKYSDSTSLSVAANTSVGATIVTNGTWAPTTAEFAVVLIIQFDPY